MCVCVTGDCNYNIRHVEITDMKNSFYGFLVINEPDSADSWGGCERGEYTGATSERSFTMP